MEKSTKILAEILFVTYKIGKYETVVEEGIYRFLTNKFNMKFLSTAVETYIKENVKKIDLLLSELENDFGLPKYELNAQNEYVLNYREIINFLTDIKFINPNFTEKIEKELIEIYKQDLENW